MGRTRQVAKAQIGAYEFKVTEQKKATGDNFYTLHRIWFEYTPVGAKRHSTIDGKFEFYADVLRTLAEYQQRYYHYCRVPTIHEISV